MAHPCIKSSSISTDEVNERTIIKPAETGIFYFFFLQSRATAGAYSEYLSSQLLTVLDVLLIQHIPCSPGMIQSCLPDMLT